MIRSPLDSSSCLRWRITKELYLPLYDIDSDRTKPTHEFQKRSNLSTDTSGGNNGLDNWTSLLRSESGALRASIWSSTWRFEVSLFIITPYRVPQSTMSQGEGRIISYHIHSCQVVCIYIASVNHLLGRILRFDAIATGLFLQSHPHILNFPVLRTQRTIRQSDVLAEMWAKIMISPTLRSATLSVELPLGVSLFASPFQLLIYNNVRRLVSSPSYKVTCYHSLLIDARIYIVTLETNPAFFFPDGWCWCSALPALLWRSACSVQRPGTELKFLVDFPRSRLIVMASKKQDLKRKAIIAPSVFLKINRPHDKSGV